MKRDLFCLSAFFALIAVFVLASFTSAFDDDAEIKTERSPILVKLEGRLKEIVQKAHPEATVHFRDEAHDELVCEYLTQTFMVHSVGKTGTVSAQARKEVGPNLRGFLVRITVQEDSYSGPSGRPYGVHFATYWHRYINEYKIPGGQRVVLLDLSYGRRPNTKLLSEIRTLCSEFGVPIFKIDKKPELLKESSNWRDYDSAEQEWEYFKDIVDAN